MRGSRRALGLAAGLVVLALAAHLRAIFGGWIWDDGANVTDCAPVLAWNGLARIWLDPTAIQQYYPMVHTTFWIEHQLWGLHPLGFHAVNVLLHALNALLVWRVLRRLGLSETAAWIGAALFAVHPVHTETVAWVTERKNTLSFAFFAGSALWWLRWAGLATDGRVGEGSARVWAVSFGLFLLALLSKSATVTLPILLLLVAWWKRGRWGKSELSLVPYLLSAIASGLLTIYLERSNVGTERLQWSFSFAERLLVVGRSLFFYAGKLLFPLDLNFIYPRWKVDVGAPGQWLFPAAALALLATLFAWRSRIGRGPLAAALAWSAALAPMLGFLDLFFYRYSFVSDHFQYHASPAAFALAGVGLDRLGTKLFRRPSWLPHTLLVLLLGGLGALTVARIPVFHDLHALWSETLRKNPDAWIAWNNLGQEALDAGRTDEAETMFHRAIAADSTQHEAWNNLGVCLLDRGRPAEAVPAFARAIRLHPTDITATENLGRSLLLSGRSREAVEVLRQATALPRHGPEPMVDLVEALARTGQADEAERICRSGREGFPADPRFDLVLATLLRRRGNWAEATQALEHAASLTGRRDPVVLDAWALLLAEQRRFEDAARIEAEALALGPGPTLEPVLRERLAAYRRGEMP